MTRRIILSLTVFLTSLTVAGALPVSLGEIEIGLESFDGYQEGTARLSTDETGTALEILIGYRGFGLDTVTWTLSAGDMSAFRGAAADAAWWRSRLLELEVGQTVIRDAANVNPALIYAYRGQNFPFEAAEHVLRFVRQGREYALLFTESSPGAETRRSGEKTLPVFTLHFGGPQLPALRDMVALERMDEVLADYAAEKATVERILNSGPDTDEGK